MNKIHVAMDESDDSLRGLALGQHLARQLAVPLNVTFAVEADPGRTPV